MPAADITSAMTSAAEKPWEETSPSITPDPPAAEPGEGVEVAADAVRPGGRWPPTCGVALEHRGRGQQLELEVVGQLQLALQPLAAEVPLHQPGVLDGGADLVGHRRDQLASEGVKVSPTEPVGEVDDADAARAARRGVADRDAQEGLAPVAARVMRTRGSGPAGRPGRTP